MDVIFKTKDKTITYQGIIVIRKGISKKNIETDDGEFKLAYMLDDHYIVTHIVLYDNVVNRSTDIIDYVIDSNYKENKLLTTLLDRIFIANDADYKDLRIFVKLILRKLTDHLTSDDDKKLDFSIIDELERVDIKLSPDRSFHKSYDLNEESSTEVITIRTGTVK